MIKQILILFLVSGICFAQDENDKLGTSALNRVNQYRDILGLKPVRQNSLLNKAAQAHADYSVANKYKGHEVIVFAR